MAGEITGPPAVDFYGMLSGLSKTLADNRTAQAKRDAFTSATAPGPDGTVDFGRAMLGLAQVDPQAAALFSAAQNHQDTLKQQGIDNTRNSSNDARAASQFQQTYALQKRSADRADDPTPDNFVRDATAPGGYRPIGPADPAYLEQVAAAKARAAALSPPEGFQRTPEGVLAPVTGGPTDPAYIGASEAAKAKAKAAAGGDSPEYGLNPIYGVGPDGKPSIVQLSKNGKTLQPQFPDGFQISKDPIRVDVGTHINLIDPQTRQIVGTLPKNIAEVERQKVVGDAQGTAQLALPTVKATADQMLKTINDVEKHPSLGNSVGIPGQFPVIPGTGRADFSARADQLKGQTFLQAYTTLRGSGAITDIEGKKGEDAIARLNRSQSEESYRAALKDLKEVVQGGVLRASAKARGPTATPADAVPGGRTKGGIGWSIVE
jgi:hypothetical protein